MTPQPTMKPLVGMGLGLMLGALGLVWATTDMPPGDDLPNGDGEEGWAAARRRMVETQIRARGVRDERVLRALREVPRHMFVPRRLRGRAHEDRALPLEKGQTISQPYIVGLMSELAEPGPRDVALDVGTGSGYQAAVLSRLVSRVYSVEIVPELAEGARRRLSDLGYTNIDVRQGDGSQGWPGGGTFDVIVAAAAPGELPERLAEQLAVGGRLVMPVGALGDQRLVKVIKRADGTLERTEIIPVSFVPMVGAGTE